MRPFDEIIRTPGGIGLAGLAVLLFFGQLCAVIMLFPERKEKRRFLPAVLQLPPLLPLPPPALPLLPAPLLPLPLPAPPRFLPLPLPLQFLPLPLPPQLLPPAFQPRSHQACSAAV